MKNILKIDGNLVKNSSCNRKMIDIVCTSNMLNFPDVLERYNGMFSTTHIEFLQNNVILKCII